MIGFQKREHCIERILTSSREGEQGARAHEKDVYLRVWLLWMVVDYKPKSKLPVYMFKTKSRVNT